MQSRIGAIPAKSKTKEKKDSGRQTTLFGLPAPEREKMVLSKKKKLASDDTQATAVDSPAGESQEGTRATDVIMAPDSQEVEEESQVPTEIDANVSVQATCVAFQTDNLRTIGRWQPGADRLGTVTRSCTYGIGSGGLSCDN